MNNTCGYTLYIMFMVVIVNLQFGYISIQMYRADN